MNLIKFPPAEGPSGSRDTTVMLPGLREPRLQLPEVARSRSAGSRLPSVRDRGPHRGVDIGLLPRLVPPPWRSRWWSSSWTRPKRTTACARTGRATAIPASTRDDCDRRRRAVTDFAMEVTLSGSVRFACYARPRGEDKRGHRPAHGSDRLRRVAGCGRCSSPLGFTCAVLRGTQKSEPLGPEHELGAARRVEAPTRCGRRSTVREPAVYLVHGMAEGAGLRGARTRRGGDFREREARRARARAHRVPRRSRAARSPLLASPREPAPAPARCYCEGEVPVFELRAGMIVGYGRAIRN